jgi:hypothetical protein
MVDRAIDSSGRLLCTCSHGDTPCALHRFNLKLPPAGWPQRMRRGLPFPPGIDDQEFEIIKTLEIIDDEDWQVYQLNCATGEVFHETKAGKWDQPPWHELPPLVRARIHEVRRSAQC